MSNLLVEIGNTALKAAWSEGSTLGKTIRYQGEKLHGFLLKTLIGEEHPKVIVLSSVRDLPEEDIREIESKCDRLVLLDSAHTSILRAYSLPEYLSPDRAASIIAARKLFKDKKFILFDIGTTLSADFIDADGSYLGGNISLGCRTRFKALNRYARALPLVNTPKEKPDSPGHSLAASIEAGVVGGIMFEIDGYMASAPGSIAVFTGGDAEYFAALTAKSVFVVPNMVLMGLSEISLDYDN